ncbi:MAG: cisplatin damage response ATP-dependent DNA ligase [Bryobacterales bacterium]|nr:cisplatin damage response ATP-dependent DNA ligase [Bryobacterales bacterium]
MDRFAEVCERVAATNSRRRKIGYLADYLRGLDDSDLARAVSFLTGMPVLRGSETKLSIGGATLRDAALEATGWDVETWRVCHRDCGDTGETISLLLMNRPGDTPMTLAMAEEYYVRLLLARPATRRVALLREIFEQHRPLALRYFVKTFSGNYRIGLQEKMVEEAIAEACGIRVDEVRAANNRLGVLSKVAIAARGGQLHEIEARLFHPMEFMLAKPYEDVAPIDPKDWWVEDKYDGIRAQVHRSQGKVRIYTRGMEDATGSFPELVAAFDKLPGSAILDGEVLAFREGRALPFAVLQQRLARKSVPEKLRTEIPVGFLAYDLLFADGELLLDLPIERRRDRLEHQPGVTVSPQRILTESDDLDELWRGARERGNEGLVLKRRGSVYESGKRSGAWCKVKKPFGTLDVVITAAEQGSGRRATMLSDYTFGVWNGERFVNVGKAYSGLTDDEVRELTRLLRTLGTDRFGRVLLVKPEVVLEVAFDGIQQSSRHKSGYALRFPRILRWRKDKPAHEADTLETVRSMYEASLR